MTAATGWERYWGSKPHVHVGDPCFLCAVPMVPASRWAYGLAVPEGHRRHGSHGLCDRCYRKAGRNWDAINATVEAATP